MNAVVRPRLLFVGNFRWNAGSAQTLMNYAAVADRVGCEIGVSSGVGWADERVSGVLPMIDDLSWATHLLFAYEDPQFLSHREIEACLTVPRDRRVVIDTDAHWGPEVTVGGDSSGGIYTSARWNSLYATLSDLILQPRLGDLPAGAVFFPYFGMARPQNGTVDSTDCDVQYIGNNWWRWESLQRLVTAARKHTKSVRVCGRWWDAETCPGYREPTWSDPDWLAQQAVEVQQSVPLGQMVPHMARATVTPVLARPKLAAMKLLMPRVFETLASGSIPLIAPETAYLEQLLGPGTRSLLMDEDVIGRMIADPGAYTPLLTDMQRRTYADFTYEKVLASLLRIIT
ncbi:glycosyltransferase [Streptomyces sp. NPDC051976]|uniref:glycosyltransferase n=1 Tax=Streptomyces sp. NPDC051976 TaxID=3154947 RepID=UPI00341F7D54